MGKKAKGSRKGKKAWRANISTEDIEDFFEKSTKDALSGGSLEAFPNESLFYVDKSKGNYSYSLLVLFYFFLNFRLLFLLFNECYLFIVLVLMISSCL